MQDKKITEGIRRRCRMEAWLENEEMWREECIEGKRVRIDGSGIGVLAGLFVVEGERN